MKKILLLIPFIFICFSYLKNYFKQSSNNNNMKKKEKKYINMNDQIKFNKDFKENKHQKVKFKSRRKF